MVYYRHVMLRVALLVLVLVIPGWPSRGQDAQTLIVFAASSLTDAFTEIGAAFQEAHSDVQVLFNFAGSSLLATQLVEGAPADVFASANGEMMQVVQEAGRVDEMMVQSFTGNRLMLAVPGDNPAQIESLADLARPGLLLVLGAPDVPVRTYTDEVLEALAIDPAFGEDYREAVLANLVSEEANVRQVVAKIALGEADAGIVYGSDITPDLADRMLALPIPDGVNPTIKYPIVMINDTARPELAMAFIDFVLSQAGQDTLLAWGFCPLASGEDSEMRGRVDVTPEAKTTDTHQDEETLHAC